MREKVAKRDIEQQVFSPLVCGLAVYIKHISGEEGGTNLKGLRALATPLTHSLAEKASKA